jgi:phosphorylcholine metabolism protein LicD
MLFKIFLNEKGNPKNIYKKLLAFKRIKNSKFFDKKYYTKISNIDKSEIDPLYHYMYFGYKEGNNPSKNFDNEYYIKKYPDVKRSGMNPLEHYVLYGQKENRFINETVDLENIFRIAKENTIKYEALKEEYTKIESCNKEFHELFNILFVHMNFETKGTLKIFQEIWVLFLDLINKICKKHSIKFWLDYGVLLGAIRHEDFIPWDYDLDIGMMRNDYNKFLTAIKKEIKDNNLENLILLNRSSYTGFLKVQSPMFDPAYFCATVDVFPYDYTKEEDMKLLTIKYEKIQTDLINFYQENNDNNCGSFLVGLNSNKEDSFHKEIQEVSKKKLKILISESENIIPGIDRYQHLFILLE